MTDFQYKRAPITEAVIGISFAERIDSDILESTEKRFALHYPERSIVRDVSVHLDVNESDQSLKPSVTPENSYRRSANDVTQILLLRKDSLLFSQLAPYQGWTNFIERFQRDWKIWKRVVGHKTLSRIGVRFINRIDIPMDGEGVDFDKFLNFFPSLPKSLEPVNAYAIQTSRQFDDGCSLNLNSAVIPSPLYQHISFLLDIDISNSNPPQNDSKLFDLLDTIRVKKNQIFEDCITDQARSLFNDRK